MTDPELIPKKLALIETSVRELQTLARTEEIASDIREQRFVEHTLQIAIQAALDAASHVVSDERLGEPVSYRELLTCWGKPTTFPRTWLGSSKKWRDFETFSSTATTTSTWQSFATS